jgi:ParB-like chromosome segregation protein Spo0J
MDEQEALEFLARPLSLEERQANIVTALRDLADTIEQRGLTDHPIMTFHQPVTDTGEVVDGLPQRKASGHVFMALSLVFRK